jgi:haloacetate dehalogenase
VDCPALVFWGDKGGIARLFDIPELWAPRLSRMHTATLPGGHFFMDQFPEATAEILRGFLVSAGSAS